MLTILFLWCCCCGDDDARCCCSAIPTFSQAGTWTVMSVNTGNYVETSPSPSDIVLSFNGLSLTNDGPTATYYDTSTGTWWV